MAKKPLYPHVPKKKEPLFPHGEKALKDPWQMTRAEYLEGARAWRAEYKSQLTGKALELEMLGVAHGHKRHVENALGAGKPVSPEVLADYPDLIERQAKDKIAKDSFGKAYEELGPERQLGVDLAYLRDQGELLPQTVSSEYRDLLGLIDEPLPSDAY